MIFLSSDSCLLNRDRVLWNLLHGRGDHGAIGCEIALENRKDLHDKQIAQS